ncbi:MAG TPA: TIGR03435 family protein [Candidatus Angelobacter sp.]
MKMLLARAYGMRAYQISGPNWMETERYDIDAKYPAETKPEDFRLLLQKLLADRFRLVLHRKMREMSRYRLVVAKGGPKLSPAQKLPEYKDAEERKAAMLKQAKANLEAMMRRPRTGPSRWLSQASGTMEKLAENLSGSVETSDGRYGTGGVLLVLAGVVAG